MQDTIEPTQTVQQLPPAATGRDNSRVLWVFGPLPPPVTGMTLATSLIVRALERYGTVRSYNWSPGMAQRSLLMRLRRNARMMRSIALLVARGPVKNDRLYLFANSASGLYSTAMVLSFSTDRSASRSWKMAADMALVCSFRSF